MGHAGHVLLYVFDGKMTPYLVTFNSDIEGYEVAHDAIENNIEMFGLRPGGMGNGLLFKKDTLFTIDRENKYLLYVKDSKNYQIDCSCRGLFMGISNYVSQCYKTKG
jgi:hypothetical protein